MRKRILIVGAGVIGSLYALRFFQKGFDVTLLARGERLQGLQIDGLRYNEKSTVKSVHIRVIDKLDDSDLYDFIFAAVRYDQMESALMSLRENQSPIIVTLSNAVTYDRFIALIGSRLLPGFPGAGGDIKDGTLFARFVSKTIFGEIDGSRSKRVRELASVLETAGLPFEISDNITAFHRSHAAVTASHRHFYTNESIVDIQTARSSRLLKLVATEIKSNLGALDVITPASTKIFLKLPKWLIVSVYKAMLALPLTRDALLGSHALGARAETVMLSEELRDYL
jgi:2-dehydropantoate 2-reductase